MSGDFSKMAFVLYHLVIIFEDMLARSARKSSEGTAVLSFRLYVRAKLLASCKYLHWDLETSGGGEPDVRPRLKQWSTCACLPLDLSQ